MKSKKSKSSKTANATVDTDTSSITPGQWDIHPLAKLFPPISETQFTRLAKDIGLNGQQQPIVIYEDMILDGRARNRAVHEAGRMIKWNPLPPDIDPLSFVISCNLHRRHLSTRERTLIAGRLAKFVPGDVSSQRNDGSNGPSLTVAEAANLCRVSSTGVKRAKAVLERGSDELVRKVEDGQISLAKATSMLSAGESLSVPIEADGPIGASAEEPIKTAKKAVSLMKGIPLDHAARRRAFLHLKKFIVSELLKMKEQIAADGASSEISVLPTEAES